MSRFTRRTFVKGVAASAGLSVVGGVSPKANAAPITDRSLRLGVAGIGLGGVRHLEYFHYYAPHLEVPASVIAAADPWEVRARWAEKEYGVETTTDGFVLIARDDIDGIIIATPDHLHAPLAIAAMQAGKHVYCETPMGLSHADAQRVAEAARDTGCAYSIGIDCLSQANHAFAKKLIGEGAVGPLRGVHMRYAYPGYYHSPCQFPEHAPEAHEVDWNAYNSGFMGRRDSDVFTNWRGDRSYSGGVATELFYEKIVPALDLIGAKGIKHSDAAGGAFAEGRTTPDAMAIHAETTEGIHVAIGTAPKDLAEDALVVRGEYGTLRFDIVGVYVLAEPGCEKKLSRFLGGCHNTHFAVDSRNVKHHIQRWIAAVRGEEPRNTHLDLCLAAHEVIEPALPAYA